MVRDLFYFITLQLSVVWFAFYRPLLYLSKTYCYFWKRLFLRSLRSLISLMWSVFRSSNWREPTFIWTDRHAILDYTMPNSIRLLVKFDEQCKYCIISAERESFFQKLFQGHFIHSCIRETQMNNSFLHCHFINCSFWDETSRTRPPLSLFLVWS